MKLKQIEDEALHLPEKERAELAQKLLLSLAAHTAEETEEGWLLEAHRRAREIDEGIVQPIPMEEVRKKARALLRKSSLRHYGRGSLVRRIRSRNRYCEECFGRRQGQEIW